MNTMELVDLVQPLLKERYPEITNAFGKLASERASWWRNACGELANVVAHSESIIEEAEKMRASLGRCLVILRHKEIRPPMQPGIQEKFEKEADEAIKSYDKAKGRP